MTMAQVQHTPGPWELDIEEYGFRIRMGSAVPYTGIYEPQHVIEWDPGVYPSEDQDEADAEHRQYLEAKANMERIVACVNASEGIPTEALEAGVVRELVEACEKARNVLALIETFIESFNPETALALLDRVETLERQLERAIDVAVNAALTMAVEDTGQMGLWALHDTAVQRAKELLEGGATHA